MNRYLDPTNDYAFKKLFGDKERLIGFLNSILRFLEGNKIIDIEYIPTQSLPIFAGGKDSIFDLKVTDQAGKWYIIEMQRVTTSAYLSRVQFYGCHTYISQLDQGHLYKNLLPVIVVSIIGDKVMPDELPCINYHALKEATTGKQYLFSTTYVFVELGKFKETNIQDLADEWMHLLKCASREQEPYNEIHDKTVLSAYNALEQFHWSREEHDAYVRASLAKDNIEAGLEDRFNEGMTQGREEGSKQRNHEIALGMLKQGLDIDLISSITGLSNSEIQKFKVKS